MVFFFLFLISFGDEVINKFFAVFSSFSLLIRIEGN